MPTPCRLLHRRNDASCTSLLIATSVATVLFILGCSKPAKLEDETAPVVRLRAPLTSSEWPTTDLSATNSAHIQDRSTFSGSIAVARAGLGPFLSGNSELVIGHDATVAGSVSADSVELRDRAIVSGSATYNNRLGGGTVLGESNVGLQLPMNLGLPELPDISPGAQAIVVNHGQQQALSRPAIFGRSIA